MKRILFILILLNAFNSIAQHQDTLFIGEVYQDVKSKLLVEKIFHYESLNKDNILNRFTNMFGYNIRNYDLYKTSEHESKIILHYVRNLYSYDDNVLDMYIIIIADFKDNKMRIRVYDDGNVYKPSIYSGNSKVVMSKDDRTFFLYSYFNNDSMIIYNTKPSLLNAREKNVKLISDYINGINTLLNDINRNILITKPIKSDW